MYKSFEIKNFRCFRDLKVTEFERVNLIAGMNDVGKTTLLEALFIHAGPFNPELAIRVNIFRGIERLHIEVGKYGEGPWDSLFSNFKIDTEVEFIGELENIGKRLTKLIVVQKPEELNKISQFLQVNPDDISNIESMMKQRDLTDFNSNQGKNFPMSPEIGPWDKITQSAVP